MTEKAKSIIESVNKFSDGKLKDIETFGLLVNIAVESGKDEVLNEISFNSKFAWKIMKFIDSGRKFKEVNDDFGERINSELMKSVEVVKNLIEGLISSLPENERENFKAKYLDLTPKSFENLINLIHDFYWMKNWLVDGSGKEI